MTVLLWGWLSWTPVVSCSISVSQCPTAQVCTISSLRLLFVALLLLPVVLSPLCATGWGLVSPQPIVPAEQSLSGSSFVGSVLRGHS